VRAKILLFSITSAILSAQAVSSVWDGVYSTAQAAKGEALYGTECLSCHGDDLLGTGPFPALTGAEFRKEWDGQAVGDLFERMRTSMPATKPGSLSGEQNAAILAFILKSNGYPGGKAELSGDTAVLGKIQFQAQKR
jgi:mono/diheme cytochrome c family protein